MELLSSFALYVLGIFLTKWISFWYSFVFVFKLGKDLQGSKTSLCTCDTDPTVYFPNKRTLREHKKGNECCDCTYGWSSWKSGQLSGQQIPTGTRGAVSTQGRVRWTARKGREARHVTYKALYFFVSMIESMNLVFFMSFADIQREKQLGRNRRRGRDLN